MIGLVIGTVAIYRDPLDPGGGRGITLAIPPHRVAGGARPGDTTCRPKGGGMLSAAALPTRGEALLFPRSRTPPRVARRPSRRVSALRHVGESLASRELVDLRVD